MKILIVEDEFEAANSYRKYLEQKNYVCDIVPSVSKAKNLLSNSQYDILILDLNLEDGLGSEVVEYIKNENIDIYTLVVSANSTDKCIVDLINNGADDYLVKPVNLEVLDVKIKALLRHKDNTPNSEIVFGKFTYDYNKSCLKIEDIEIILSKKEHLILRYLISNHDILVTSEMLVNNVYDQYYDSSSATIRVHIYNLKKKINLKEELLVSYPKKGYKLCLNQLI